MPSSTSRLAALLLIAAAVLPVHRARARVLRVEITQSTPAFGGRSFGDAGTYRHLVGHVRGEVDPADPQDALIQDLWLAPRDARGRVAYDADIDILVPADPARANRVLLVEVPNRGNKLAPGFFNLDVPPGTAARNALADPGDGYLYREGYTLAWVGWEQDLTSGDGRLRMRPVVAHAADGGPITGLVRATLTTTAPAGDLPLTATAGATPPVPYAAADTDNRRPDAHGFVPTLTVRANEQAPRVPIAADHWHFGACTAGTAASGTPIDATRVCLAGGFQPGRLYELIYRARDPLVQGLGFAVLRDVGAFLRDAHTDDAGTPNPVYAQDQRAIIEGSSQSGRFIRSFLALGFNEREGGGRVYDGALVHLAGGFLPLNVRFGQPFRNGGDQTDRDYPGYAFPFSYLRQTDPLTGATAGVLDRCEATATCPRIFHVATALEFWELRQSLGLTDPLGRADLPDLPNVRTYVLASTQHIPAALPLAPSAHCQYTPNPNPQNYTLRALLLGFARWVRDGIAPPPSVVPRIADGTLVPVDQVRFPAIPATDYGGIARPAVPPVPHDPTPLHVLFYGPRYNQTLVSGEIAIEPPTPLPGGYAVLVPQVDADGNDAGGIRSVFQQVPIGTYTGWNLDRDGWFTGGLCHLQGSFIPFARTRAERLAAGDPRLSIEERYPTRPAYVLAMRRAVSTLNTYQFLLPEDAAALVDQAERDGVRSEP